MDNCVWSKSLQFNFIEEYKQYKCLWLIRDPNYYNKKIKNEAYDELVNLTQDEFPNADVLFVKKKIKNMRNAFLKEYKKKNMKFQEGINYEPKLWYFDLLMFTVIENDEPLITEDEEDDEVEY